MGEFPIKQDEKCKDKKSICLETKINNSCAE